MLKSNLQEDKINEFNFSYFLKERVEIDKDVQKQSTFIKKNYINKNITKLETFGSTYIYEINDLYISIVTLFFYIDLDIAK
jgi:hypothetical protein